MRSTFCFLGLALMLTSCGSEEQVDKEDEITAFDKLAGTWQLKNQPSYERWIKQDANTYIADDFVTGDTDTIFTEKISLSKSVSKDWSYNVRLLTQDTVRQVTFTIDSISENTMRFVNPQNAFPKALTYHFPSDSIMQVTLDGEDAVPVYLVFKKQK